jgi:hypothetical protein
VTSALESRIDELYRGSLHEFTAARNALAKTLQGTEAQRVRKLAKPTVVPWAVNQVYWRSRTVWDRLMKTGERLRTAQVASLEGRKADVRAASEAHRQAIADAVQQAESIAAAEQIHPAPDALTRTFEALSLAPQMAEPAGRVTKPIQPAGFEALSGVKLATPPTPKEPTAAEKKRIAKEDAERKRAEAERKKHEAEVRKAEAALERARQRMAEAEAALREQRKK